MANGPTIEELEAKKKALAEYEAKLDSISRKEAQLANAARNRLLASQAAAQEELKLQNQLDKLLDEKNVKDKKAHDAEIVRVNDMIEQKKREAEWYKKAQAENDALLAKTQKVAGMAQKAQRDANKQAEEDLVNFSNNLQKENELGLKEIGGAIEGSFEAIGGAFESISQSPEMLLAGMGGFNLGISALQGKILAMPAAMDEAFSGVVKNTNMGADSAKKSMTAMLDPLYAARKDAAFKNLAEDSRLMANIGLTADDVGESMSSLINGVAMFRPEFIESNKVQAAFIGNLTAGLKKVGVPIETSAKNLNRFTKAMAMSPKEAATGLKQLTGIADSLGLSFASVSNNFAQVGGDMVQFGDRAINVFANLQAQATATGMSINELTEFAKGLDTFEGAAQKAQGLNAVLGGTFVSVTDLVNADFDEKIELMQGAMADAGIEFDQADRRMQQVIASAAGLSVEQAAKMFGNKEASEEMRDSVDDQAMSTAELEAKITDSMSVTEKATRSLSSMAGGVSEFNKRLNVAAKDINKTVTREFGSLMEKTQNSEAALLGIIGGLEGLEVAGKIGVTAIQTLGQTLAKAAPVATALAGGLAGTAAAVEAQEGYERAEEQRKRAEEAPVTPPTVEPAAAPNPLAEELRADREARAAVDAAAAENEDLSLNQPMVFKLMLPDNRVLAESVVESGLVLKKPDILLQ